MKKIIKVEVLSGGMLPCKANPTDAGFDVYATEDIALYPGERIKHPLNIKLELPEGTWAQIETKSGLGSKGMLVYAGVIDEGYRGIPHVIATNLNPPVIIDDVGDPRKSREQPIIVLKGQKLAQFTMNPHSNDFVVEQVETVVANTDRGVGGFGSSGT